MCNSLLMLKLGLDFYLLIFKPLALTFVKMIM